MSQMHGQFLRTQPPCLDFHRPRDVQPGYSTAGPKAGEPPTPHQRGTMALLWAHCCSSSYAGTHVTLLLAPASLTLVSSRGSPSPFQSSTPCKRETERERERERAVYLCRQCCHLRGGFRLPEVKWEDGRQSIPQQEESQPRKWQLRGLQAAGRK